MTVYFQRIGGFAEIAERLPPEMLVHILTEYLTVMTATIENRKGIVDRTIGIGDTMVAFWGARDETDHADNACACAMDAVERGRNLSRKWQAKGIPPLDVAIGINSGRVMLGNFGTPTRFQYTILGDAVNLASRLAGFNGRYGTEILLSEFTRGAAAQAGEAERRRRHLREEQSREYLHPRAGRRTGVTKRTVPSGRLRHAAQGTGSRRRVTSRARRGG